MVKVCQNLFPDNEGFYISEFLKENLDPLAEALLDDHAFVIAISGDGEVRVGKSVIAQQVATYLTDKINRLWKLNNVFDVSNIVFRGDDLINTSFQKQKGSVIVLDEGDDLTEHYQASVTRELRKYFRKCGQLNQILILILPDFFELPKPIAITRTRCLINVKYKPNSFSRGDFNFYNKTNKKYLYINGKKYSDYNSYPANFPGSFTNFYTVNEEEYRAKKHKDLTTAEEEGFKSRKGSKYLNESIALIAINYLKNEIGLSWEEINRTIYDNSMQIKALRATISDANSKEKQGQEQENKQINTTEVKKNELAC